MKQKSCDFIAVSKYHKSLWSDNMWQNDACFVSQENFRTACKMSKNIHCYRVNRTEEGHMTHWTCQAWESQRIKNVQH